VQDRKVQRIVTRLAAEGQSMPLEDYFEHGPVARRIIEDENRDRIVALLLRKFLEAPVPEEPEAADLAPGAGGARESGGAPRRGRPRRRGRGRR
jgi:hypothetical protein